jgi:hypothetical protein
MSFLEQYAKGKTKAMDDAMKEPKTAPTVTVHISTGDDLGALPTPPANRKYDSFLGKYVDTKDWKSSQQHYDEEDAAKGKK